MHLDELAACFSRFFCGDADKVAFYRTVKRSISRHLAFQNIVQGVNKVVVAAAVPVPLFRKVLQGNRFPVLAVNADENAVRFFVQGELTMRAKEVHSSAAASGERRHRQ